LVIVLVSGSATAGQCQTTAKKLRLQLGKKAPMFFLRDTEGKMFFLKEHCGRAREPKKVIILDFFSTVCDPCKRELPHLARLYRKYKDRKVSLVVVGYRQKSETLVPYLKTKKLTDLLVLSDLYGIVSKKYGAEKARVARLPRTVVLDGGCKVRVIIDGETKAPREKLASVVKALLR